jgi:hypothetical protein
MDHKINDSKSAHKVSSYSDMFRCRSLGCSLENYKMYYNCVVVILPTIAGIPILYKNCIYSVTRTLFDNSNNVARHYPQFPLINDAIWILL